MSTSAETKLLLKILQHYAIIQILYPDKLLSVSELTSTLKKDQGNISRALKELEKLHIIQSTSEKGIHGRQRKVKLTSLVKNLFNYLTRIMEKNLYANEMPPELLREYLTLIQSDDEALIDMGITTLIKESDEKTTYDAESLITIKNILNENIRKKEILAIIKNFVKNSDEDKRVVYSKIFLEPLNRFTKNMEETEENRHQAFTILSEILPQAELYNSLFEHFYTLIESNSIYVP
ncbi:MAG: hypothetical protein NTY03_00805, partial [Candidatus Bathyarchaeota archaeon]|nr:hypothetical protein [Candidatus Bathyarchaeota archaeon]